MIKILIFLFPVFLLSSNLGLNDFKASFTQTITTPKNKKITYSGVIKFSKKTMKWEYRKPTKKEICSKNNEFLVVDHDLEQVTLMKSSRSVDFLEVLNKAKFYKNNIYTTKLFGKTYTLSVKNKKLIYITFYDDLENKVVIYLRDHSFSKFGNMKCNYPNDYDFIVN